MAQEGSRFEWRAFVTHLPTELRVARLRQELMLWLVISNTVRDALIYFYCNQETRVICKNVAEVVYSLGVIMQDTVTMSSLL